MKASENSTVHAYISIVTKSRREKGNVEGKSIRISQPQTVKTIMCLNSQLFDDFELPLCMSLYVYRAMCATLKCEYN